MKMGVIVMIKISNKVLLSSATKLLLILVVAKALSLALFLYLPSDGVDIVKKRNYQPKYQRVDLKNMIASTNTSTKRDPIEQDISVSITNMILKGLYGTSKKGFVIVALKKSPSKTSIVGVGEDFSGYTLKSIAATNVVFTKLNKDYILELEKIKSDKSYIQRVNKRTSNGAFKKSDSSYSSDEPRVVTRDDIAAYAKNPKQIWREISIVPLQNGKKLGGFKVTKIKKGSKMAQLGLKKGDVIIKANNIKLKSYKDALTLYSNINDIDTMQIVVLRNNIEKELVYEIN